MSHCISTSRARISQKRVYFFLYFDVVYILWLEKTSERMQTKAILEDHGGRGVPTHAARALPGTTHSGFTMIIPLIVSCVFRVWRARSCVGLPQFVAADIQVAPARLRQM
jgi:hypothetical protein